MSALRRPAIQLAFALTLYALLRALVLASNFDEVAMPQFELFPMGTIPLMLGVDGGLPVARVYDNAAGQILTGLLAVPSYALFGPSYLALKLVPVALGAVALVAVWALLRELLDERAAFAGALLFALAPTTVTKYSMMASGNHFETLCFTALALWSSARMQRLGVSPVRLLASSFAAGFAVFVFLGALTPVALLGLVHLGLRGWRATLRDLAWLVPGFAIGLAPLIALNWMTGGRGLAFLDQKFDGANTEFDAVRVVQRLREFFVEHLPAASQFHDFAEVPGRFAQLLFLAVFAAAYLSTLPLAGRGLLALVRGAFGRGAPDGERAAVDQGFAFAFCAYLPLTAAAYAMSNLKIEPKPPPMDAEGYRYFNTHFLFAIVVIAWATGRWRQRKPIAAAGLWAAALITGAFNLALVDWSFERANLGSYYDGFNVKQTANQLLSPRNGYAQEQVLRIVEAYPAPYRSWLYLGLGRVRAGQALVKSRGGELELWSVLEQVPDEHRADVARGFGVFFRHLGRMQGKLDPRYVALVTDKLASGAPHAAAAIEGLAMDWEVHLARDLERDLREQSELAEALPRQFRPHLARGFGAVCGRTLQRGIPYEVRLVRGAAESVPSELRAAFYEGLGAGSVEGLRAPALEGPLAEHLPEDADLAALERGARARRSALGP
ncbi:MAG: hypothetical protein IT454_01480 [Planctomycetes bacterium]|nr:hypothetical protein [Planctomycetota bacterium]